jgi:hypothetical protein
VRALVTRGAEWNPDASTLNDLRLTLYSVAPEVTVGLVGLFGRLQGERKCEESSSLPLSERCQSLRR